MVTREEGILAALDELAPNAEVVVSAKAGYTPEGVDVGCLLYTSSVLGEQQAGIAYTVFKNIVKWYTSRVMAFVVRKVAVL